MTIAHELLHAQYPHLGGLQQTIFSQNNGFCPVKSTVDSIQIHYTGHSHWVVSAYMKSVDKICIYDSMHRGGDLTSSLQIQLALVYKTKIR